MKRRIIDLGTKAYAETFAIQQRCNERVAARLEDETVFLVEHEPVITLTARKSARDHLLADEAELQRLGIDLQPTNRGGDITYHGPGQLVVYPVLRLRDHGLNLGSYMRLLEQSVIETVLPFGVAGHIEPGATGVWVDAQQAGAPEDAKLCALGVRLRRHTTMHGLALNVTTNLSHFKTIDPCGLGQRPVTSMKQILGDSCPAMSTIKFELTAALNRRLEAHSASELAR